MTPDQPGASTSTPEPSSAQSSQDRQGSLSKSSWPVGFSAALRQAWWEEYQAGGVAEVVYAAFSGEGLERTEEILDSSPPPDRTQTDRAPGLHPGKRQGGTLPPPEAATSHSDPSPKSQLGHPWGDPTFSYLPNSAESATGVQPASRVVGTIRQRTTGSPRKATKPAQETQATGRQKQSTKLKQGNSRY
jgi:hypothetical protein